MSEPAPPTADRLPRFEHPNDDFPYYDGGPVAISGPQWWFVMGMTALGFLALTAPIPFPAGDLGQFVPAILFFAVPLAGLAIVARRHWTAIFRRIGVRDVLWMVAFALLNLVVSFIVAFVVSRLSGAQVNPAVTRLADMTASDRVVFFLKTAPQLFGEEVLTILPFLAILYFLHGPRRLPRRSAVLGAWLGSALLFGLAHLPTYGWDFVQCVVIIGTARLVLSLAYIKTKNIWVSTGAHILNDWTTFGLTILGASLGRV